MRRASRPPVLPVLLLLGAVVVVAAGALAVLATTALVRAVVLVDAVPGADAGLATSPALEAARAQAVTAGVALLALGLLTAAAVLLALRRARGGAGRRRPARSAHR